MKILTISDSFKGSATSQEIGATITNYYKNLGHVASYYPLSDGGEGFLDVIKKVKDVIQYSVVVNNPYFEKITSNYLFDEIEKTMYVELAEASGLTKVNKDKLNASIASTYGLGELIKDGISKHHPKKIIIGIGGSATSDVGCGMLEALGVKFFDEFNNEIKHMSNQTLDQVAKINKDSLNELIKDIEFVTLSDVTNPLIGTLGAVMVYSKQKGASDDELIQMEQRVNKYYNTLGLADFSGAGAAGGVGYALKHFFNSSVTSGIDEILKMIDFDTLVKKYDIIFTGEGRVDYQSLCGKVISGIKKHNPKRLIIVCGKNELENATDEIYAITPNIATKEESMNNPLFCIVKLLEQIKL